MLTKKKNKKKSEKEPNNHILTDKYDIEITDRQTLHRRARRDAYVCARACACMRLSVRLYVSVEYANLKRYNLSVGLFLRGRAHTAHAHKGKAARKHVREPPVVSTLIATFEVFAHLQDKRPVRQHSKSLCPFERPRLSHRLRLSV